MEKMRRRYKNYEEKMKVLLQVLVTSLLTTTLCYAEKTNVISIGVLFKSLSNVEREIIQNTTKNMESKTGIPNKIRLQLWKCSNQDPVFSIGKRLEKHSTDMVICIDCSVYIIDFVSKILKIPTVSLSKNPFVFTSNCRQDTTGFISWNTTESKVFSETAKQILLKQDWYKTAVLYDVNYDSTFKDYMNVIQIWGKQKMYPLKISKNGRMDGYSLDILKIFADFSIHAIILICDENHLQNIVNTIKHLKSSHGTVMPSLIIHNPITKKTLAKINDAQIVIGFGANYTINSDLNSHTFYVDDQFQQNQPFRIILQNGIHNILKGVLECAFHLKSNETLRSKLHKNMTKYIKNKDDFQQVDIFNLYNGTFVKIGAATKDGKSVNTWAHIRPNRVNVNDLEHFKQPLRVVTIHDPPFVWITKKTNGKKDYHGFLIDILNELQRKLNFQYVLHEVKDNQYGYCVDGKRIGMIGDVCYDKADLGLAPFTVDESRSKVISFLQPFSKVNFAYLMKKSKNSSINLTQFLEPFTPNVWFTIIGSIFIVTLSICFVDHFGPNGWRQSKLMKKGEPGREFNLFNSLWFTVGCILRQGGAFINPRSASSCILTAIFWFIILIQISTYTANLVAYFTVSKSISEINDLETLAKMDYDILIFKNSVIHKQLETSTYQPYRLIYEKIAAKNTFVSSFKEALEKIRNSAERKTILLSENLFLENIANKKPCDLVSVNCLLPVRSYAFAVQFNSPLFDILSVGVSDLQESGFIESKRKHYWEEKVECPKDVGFEKIGYGQISALQMAGVCAVLLGGIFISILALIFELVWKHYEIYKKTKTKVPQIFDDNTL